MHACARGACTHAPPTRVRAGLGRRVLLLRPGAGVLHLRLPLEPAGLGEGGHAVVVRAQLRPGPAVPHHPAGAQRAATRHAGGQHARARSRPLRARARTHALAHASLVCARAAVPAHAHAPSCTPPGEEVVSRESFISICWRLIPYGLNKWEQQVRHTPVPCLRPPTWLFAQLLPALCAYKRACCTRTCHAMPRAPQWGAECSSMMFELPHFAVELLVVLPCIQVGAASASGACSLCAARLRHAGHAPSHRPCPPASRPPAADLVRAHEDPSHAAGAWHGGGSVAAGSSEGAQRRAAQGASATHARASSSGSTRSRGRGSRAGRRAHGGAWGGAARARAACACPARGPGPRRVCAQHPARLLGARAAPARPHAPAQVRAALLRAPPPALSAARRRHTLPCPPAHAAAAAAPLPGPTCASWRSRWPSPPWPRSTRCTCRWPWRRRWRRTRPRRPYSWQVRARCACVRGPAGVGALRMRTARPRVHTWAHADSCTPPSFPCAPPPPPRPPARVLLPRRSAQPVLDQRRRRAQHKRAAGGARARQPGAGHAGAPAVLPGHAARGAGACGGGGGMAAWWRGAGGAGVGQPEGAGASPPGRQVWLALP